MQDNGTGMASLHFRSGIEDAGFSSSTTSNANNADATTIVRELIQNSLDAAKEIKREKTVIRFEIEKINQNKLPGIENLKNAFPHALNTQRKLSKGSLPDIQEQIASVFQENIEIDSSYLLSVSDNGVGLNKTTMKALLGDGRSAKESSGGGAHGYGHLTVIPSSNLRFVYYGGISQSGQKVASGHCVLAPFQDENGGNFTKDGYLVESLMDDLFEPYEFLYDDKIPELILNKIDNIQKYWDSGAVVMIPSFNFFKSDSDKLWNSIRRAAATNFFASFAQDELIVEFKNGEDIDQIDVHNIEVTLQQYTHEINAKSFISGSKAMDCYEVIQTGEDIIFETEAGNVSGKLIRYKKGQSTRIDLCRNGMWIVYNNSPGKRLPMLQSSVFSDYQPFHLVLLLKASDGNLHKLIRKAEPPIHDQVDVNQLTDSDKEKLRKAFSQIQSQIKERLEKIDEEGVKMDGILDLPIGGSQSGGKHGTYAGEWQPFERVTRRSTGSENKETGEETGRRGDKKGERKKNGSGAGTKTAKTSGNAAPFKAIPVPRGSRGYEVEIHPLEDIDVGELRFMIDQNMDETCRYMNAEPLVQLQNVKLESKVIPESYINKNGKGEIISLLIPDIKMGKKFRIEFDFLPSSDLAISDNKSIALKAEIIKRKQSGGE